MWSRTSSNNAALFGLTIGFSLLAACSLDVQGRQDTRPIDPGQTSSADVIPVQGAGFEDGGTSTTDAAQSPSPMPDGAVPLAPAKPSPGAACGSVQCSGTSSDICCIEWSGGAPARACTKSDDCKGARIACDEPSDCPGSVCCLTNAFAGPGDPPRTKCESKCDDDEAAVVCDPAVGCAKGTCTLHGVLGLYYCL